MIKYLLRRLLSGLFSVFCVVIIVMTLIYSLLDRNQIFNADPIYTKQKSNNNKKEYYYQKLAEYGYVYSVSFTDYIVKLYKEEKITDEENIEALNLGKEEGDSENYYIAESDSETVRKYLKDYVELYQSQGYTIERYKAVYRAKNKLADGGKPYIVAYKDIPLIRRVLKYFPSVISIDNIHNAPSVADEDRGITFTLHDPIYGGEKFSPAIIGNGTTYKYLLYCDDSFPFVHQNLVKIKLGTSYSIKTGTDIWDYMLGTQGATVIKSVTYPSGNVLETSDDLHTLKYLEGSLENSNKIYPGRFIDDYTLVSSYKNGSSRMGYSFVLGIISTIIAYIFGIPIGIVLALNKDKFLDKLGAVYIIFIIAVPSLAYIFMFREIGKVLFGLPTSFYTDEVHIAQYGKIAMYVLPIVSLALPSIAGLMKWLRRYMIDQMNSDYVKFARSGGLSEGEIFTNHIAKNAIIPIVHGVPGAIVSGLWGAIITERLYSVPGVGNIITIAINVNDNSVIVGLTLFYSMISVIAIILGDILMALVDPRISFTTKGGR